MVDKRGTRVDFVGNIRSVGHIHRVIHVRDVRHIFGHVHVIWNVGNIVHIGNIVHVGHIRRCVHIVRDVIPGIRVDIRRIRLHVVPGIRLDVRRVRLHVGITGVGRLGIGGILAIGSIGGNFGANHVVESDVRRARHVLRVARSVHIRVCTGVIGARRVLARDVAAATR